MIQGILKGLMQWIYGLFLDLINYCANSLLSIMSTDLDFFENSVPIVPSLYQVFVAVGWGLLIGNMAFQSMKAMFAGLGIETESPIVLMLRTFLFGTLLIFSKDICDIGLSISKNVIELLGIPKTITITMPAETLFSSAISWLLVIIIGFILGFQLIKLFFEIAERYVVVAILTLLMPVGLAMGGSKSTKEICSGYLRMYASMLVLMVTNVLFLKLILSALGAMPASDMVIPWCLLIVGLTKTAQKADNIILRIGLNPAITGDPLGSGRGLMTTLIIARTIMAARGRGGYGRPQGNNAKNIGNNGNNGSNSKGSNNKVYNTNGGVNVGGESVNTGNFNAGNNMNTGYTAGSNSNVNNKSSSSSRFGATSYNTANQSGKGFSKNVSGGAGTSSKVNTNRFGIQKDKAKTGGPIVNNVGAGGQMNGKDQKIQKSKTEVNTGNNGKGSGRFGDANSGIRRNPNPMRQTSSNTPSGSTRHPTSMKPINQPISRGGIDNTRFGSNGYRRMTDDDILITREDDSDG